MLLDPELKTQTPTYSYTLFQTARLLSARWLAARLIE